MNRRRSATARFPGPLAIQERPSPNQGVVGGVVGAGVAGGGAGKVPGGLLAGTAFASGTGAGG